MNRQARQIWFVGLLAWLLAAAPALCTGGLLSHPCECPDSGGCESEETHADDHGCAEMAACAHEADCAEDPCQDALLPLTDGMSTGLAGTTLLAISLPDPESRDRSGARAYRFPPASRKLGPGSDRPLLT